MTLSVKLQPAGRTSSSRVGGRPDPANPALPMSANDDRLQPLIQLRALVGDAVKELELHQLLERHGGDVNAAANSYFDSGVNAAPAIEGTPVAQSPPSGLVQVTCPNDLGAGAELQVDTPAGKMRVTVPQGVVPGSTFLMRIPPIAAPAGLPQQQGYPGQHSLPPTVIGQTWQRQRQPPVVHVVHSQPYYGYGYGYDPFLAGSAGFLGGMLIADACARRLSNPGELPTRACDACITPRFTPVERAHSRRSGRRLFW